MKFDIYKIIKTVVNSRIYAINPNNAFLKAEFPFTTAQLGLMESLGLFALTDSTFSITPKGHDFILEALKNHSLEILSNVKWIITTAIAITAVVLSFISIAS